MFKCMFAVEVLTGMSLRVSSGLPEGQIVFRYHSPFPFILSDKPGNHISLYSAFRIFDILISAAILI